jgi:hypothetical protein
MTEPPGESAEPITTPDACVDYVNRVGLCAWRQMDRCPALPSLAERTPWDDQEVIMQTWFWKDDLHIEKRLYYGMILGSGVPAFASRDFLPYLIAAQGDNDARTLYEQGRLAENALRVYEHIQRNGPTPTNALPWPQGSRHLYLAVLQQKFLLTKHGLTGRTRGTYGYIWGLCEDHFPDAFEQAARIAVPAARAHIRAHLAAQDVDMTPKAVARLFRWSEE